MATVVIMPKFEMAQETGTVARWLKNEGDTVAKGEPLLEVETDKVTMEVEAPAAGILVNVTAPAGLVVPIGQPIAFIARPGEQMPAPAGALSAAKAAAPVADPMALAPAGAPAASAPVAPVAAPSGVINANYRATPLAERVASEHGLALSSIPGSGPQGRITREDVERVLASLDAASAATPALAPLWPDGKVRAVPAARRLARELSVELLTVAGSGPEGRIQPADVLAAAQRAVVAPVQAPASALVSSEPVLPAAPGGPAVRRTVPLTSIRRTIAERMTASVREAPQFSVSAEAEMARAQAMVEDVKAAGEGKDGPKVTLTAFLVKACAWALAAYPAANSSFDAPGARVEWADVNVGVAVATDNGLLVPVIHGADRLGLIEIAARLADITARARAGKLRLEDIQGGTFTVSNLGMLGIDRFTAILNPPQAAILAVGRVAKRPVIDENEQVVVRALSSLTLTADHRVLDGAGAAQFLALIKKVLEHPGILLR